MQLQSNFCWPRPPLLCPLFFLLGVAPSMSCCPCFKFLSLHFWNARHFGFAPPLSWLMQRPRPRRPRHSLRMALLSTNSSGNGGVRHDKWPHHSANLYTHARKQLAEIFANRFFFSLYFFSSLCFVVDFSHTPRLLACHICH